MNDIRKILGLIYYSISKTDSKNYPYIETQKLRVQQMESTKQWRWEAWKWCRKLKGGDREEDATVYIFLFNFLH